MTKPIVIQLTNEQRIFINNVYAEKKSLKEVQNEFEQRFPKRSSPTKKTVWKTVNKFRAHGTILNLTKGSSGRLKTLRTNENIERVRQVITENPKVSKRRNGTELSLSSFQRIVRNDLQYYPYRAKVKQQLLEGDYFRHLRFAHWFTERPEIFIKWLVVGDECAFHMNESVNKQICRHYAPKNHPPEENTYEISMSREKVSLWLGLCSTGSVIGPFFYATTLNGDKYLQMLDTEIILQL
ncbi:Protein of unknown function DUF4817 [Trinorchestia longiramus]|nr:Protein of unknown function DUF4817 [Trinorchestia longiramus]